MARISLIAAIGAKTRVIGKNNDLVFKKIPGDMKWFKEKTMNHPIIMGRKTFESIGSKPLPKRLNIILTRDRTFKAPGSIIAHSLKAAIRGAQRHDKEEIFVIGGGQIYEEAIKVADRVYLTLVYADAEGDVFFPEYQKHFGKLISFDLMPESEQFPYPYGFLVADRL